MTTGGALVVRCDRGGGTFITSEGESLSECVCVFITGEGESQNKGKQIWSYEEHR